MTIICNMLLDYIFPISHLSSFLCVDAYMCVHVCETAHVQVCMHILYMLVEGRRQPRGHSWDTYFVREGLSLACNLPCRLAGWPVSTRELSVSIPNTRITSAIYYAWVFLMWVLEIYLRTWAISKALAIIFFNKKNFYSKTECSIMMPTASCLWFTLWFYCTTRPWRDWPKQALGSTAYGISTVPPNDAFSEGTSTSPVMTNLLKAPSY